MTPTEEIASTRYSFEYAQTNHLQTLREEADADVLIVSHRTPGIQGRREARVSILVPEKPDWITLASRRYDSGEGMYDLTETLALAADFLPRWEEGFTETYEATLKEWEGDQRLKYEPYVELRQDWFDKVKTSEMSVDQLACVARWWAVRELAYKQEYEGR